MRLAVYQAAKVTPIRVQNIEIRGEPRTALVIGRPCEWAEKALSQKGLTPQDPLYFFYGQTHRVTKFSGTFRPTEHDSEKKLVKNWGNPPGKWI